ncbi:MAG TPA: hypothetical protein VH575_32155 [Gemmataceae bacterium]|jgi:hypothetical protein
MPEFYFNGRYMPAHRHPPDAWVISQVNADRKWSHEAAAEWLAELAGHPDYPPIRLKARDEQQAQARYKELVGMTPGVHQGATVSVSLCPES